MSGGSMDYLCVKVEEASFTLDTPERKAFKAHLSKVAKALHAIEWNDSGDGDSSEHNAIMSCITKTEVLEQAIKEGERVRDEINKLLRKA